jgi:hypothetical protein
MNRIVTVGLLCGAYLRGDTRKAYLTHRVEVDETGCPVRVLCGGAKVLSVCDDTTCYTDDPPTCPKCQRLQPNR